MFEFLKLFELQKQHTCDPYNELYKLSNTVTKVRLSQNYA